MPENTPLYQDRVLQLRKEISKEGMDGFIIPRTDEFQGEFIAPYAQRLAWVCGFTGSAGSAVILQEKTVVMSDCRYTLQLREEVNPDIFQLEDSTKTSIGQWLADNAKEGSKIGYDVWLHTASEIKKIEEHCADKQITLIACNSNLIDEVWHDQPRRPQGKVTVFPDEVAGKTAAEKCDDIAEKIKNKGAAACLLSANDSICWLLNVRGSDVAYSPLCLSYALIYIDGTVDWFIDPSKPGAEVAKKLGERVRVFGRDALQGRLSQLHTLHDEIALKSKNAAPDKTTLWLDSNTAPIWFEQAARKAGLEILNAPDPCAYPKSIKTASEQEATRQAHIQDGIALTRFLKWIDEHQNTSTEKIDELSAEEVLKQCRQKSESYIEPSFPAIIGFAANGAIVHYRANKKTCREIKGDGLLLVDSGGQYRWGTTDITRTIAIGQPDQEMKENYTRVLKGHIAVASASFPKDTAGAQIDALARRALHDAGLDYAHGTGHGVGCYLCVHEQATAISPREQKAFAPGMLISNEPGYYKEGAYGIRIENLVLVRKGDDRTQSQSEYRFETVSYAPFDPRLILEDMLDTQEKRWLREYYTKIKQHLLPHLDKEECNWLEAQIRPFI
ncbi:MAG: aminopeptidase P family protein [Alphaproteobacteria bacterium]